MLEINPHLIVARSTSEEQFEMSGKSSSWGSAGHW